MEFAHILFLGFAALAVVAAFNVILQRNPIYSAIGLIIVLCSLAALFLTLAAQFIAAMQIIVYAGAIMVLFIFVIMLLNAGGEAGRRGSTFATIMGVPLLLALLGLIAFYIGREYPKAELVQFGALRDATGNSIGSASNVGTAIFTSYLLPFEVTSVLILIAIIGAIVLARKELD
jgi:NADH-quinone oxidoreductase subunit J